MRLLLVVALLLLCVGARADEPPSVAASVDALRAVAGAGAVVEELPDDRAALLIPEPFAPPTFAVDPLYKNKTSRAVSVYEKAEATGKMARRVVVCFEPDDRDNAVRVARVAARLMELHRQLFRRETAFSRGASVARVWLVPSPNGRTDIGGETRDANVYIFAASAIKTPIELIRTVAHEWGHLTLPAARGFSEPESDAAGFLGERFYLYWMTFPLRNDPPQAYPKDAATLDALVMYNERQTLPLMKRYETGGVFSPVMRGDSTEAMDYYIGMVLSCSETFLASEYNISITGAALWSVGGEKPSDFVRSLETVMARETERYVTVERVPMLRGVLINQLPAFVPLTKGEYELESSGSGTDVLTFAGAQTLTAPLKPGSVPNWSASGILRVAKSGWYRVTATKSYTDAFRLTRKPKPVKP